MIQTERIADGRRRFFAAPGVVQDVLLRARKGHQDRGLEPGRDYEVETGGVTLRTTPHAGETVIILTGDKVRSEQALLVPVQSRQIPANPIASLSSLSSLAGERDAAAPISPMISVQPNSERDAARDMPPIVSELNSDELGRIKRALVLATRDTNDATPRTAKWQDGLAQLTAVLLAAPDWDALRAASLDIETYLRG